MCSVVGLTAWNLYDDISWPRRGISEYVKPLEQLNEDPNKVRDNEDYRNFAGCIKLLFAVCPEIHVLDTWLVNHFYLLLLAEADRHATQALGEALVVHCKYKPDPSGRRALQSLIDELLDEGKLGSSWWVDVRTHDKDAFQKWVRPRIARLAENWQNARFVHLQPSEVSLEDSILSQLDLVDRRLGDLQQKGLDLTSESLSAIREVLREASKIAEAQGETLGMRHIVSVCDKRFGPEAGTSKETIAFCRACYLHHWSARLTGRSAWAVEDVSRHTNLLLRWAMVLRDANNERAPLSIPDVDSAQRRAPLLAVETWADMAWSMLKTLRETRVAKRYFEALRQPDREKLQRLAIRYCARCEGGEPEGWMSRLEMAAKAVLGIIGQLASRDIGGAIGELEKIIRPRRGNGRPNRDQKSLTLFLDL